MMQSDAVNWSVAILLSLLVHGMILMGSGTRMGTEEAVVMQAPVITRLNFNQPLDDAVQDAPPLLEKPQPKPKLKPKPKPEPKPVKKVEAKPRPDKPAETELATEKTDMQQTASVEKAEPVRQAAVQQRAQGDPVSNVSQELARQEYQKYLYELMSHIESFKYYPRAARKRSLEGEVKVSFQILADGSYQQLSLNGRHSTLVKATRLALQSAIPLPVPPEDFSMPDNIEFLMSYSLTD